MTDSTDQPRILIAGIGNDLKRDDGFGIAVARVLQEEQFADSNVHVQEVGIGGIHMVQELMGGYDVLLLIDAVQWGEPPGSLSIRSVEHVSDVNAMSNERKSAFLADMHYATPERALMLAKALNVLPEQVYVLGCEAWETDDFAIGMHQVVADSVAPAVEMVKAWVADKAAHRVDTPRD